MNKDYFKFFNIFITAQMEEKLKTYYEELIAYNQKVNLTRIVLRNEVYIKHFLDSLIPFSNLNLAQKQILDIGSGAGFPGVILALYYPETTITLCESIGKKVLFLKHIIKVLELNNVVVFHGRAEEIKEKYDLITARAVSKVNTLLGYATRLIKPQGLVVLFKGINYQIELEKISARFKLETINTYSLPLAMGERVALYFKYLKP